MGNNFRDSWEVKKLIEYLQTRIDPHLTPVGAHVQLALAYIDRLDRLERVLAGDVRIERIVNLELGKRSTYRVSRFNPETGAVTTTHACSTPMVALLVLSYMLEDDETAEIVYGTTDAEIWAKRFMHLNTNRCYFITEEVMRFWFSNAIEAGREAGPRPPEPPRSFGF